MGTEDEHPAADAESQPLPILPPIDPLDADPKPATYRVGLPLQKEIARVAEASNCTIQMVVGAFLKSGLRRHLAEQQAMTDEEAQLSEQMLTFLRWAMQQGLSGEGERERLLGFFRWALEVSRHHETGRPGVLPEMTLHAEERRVTERRAKPAEGLGRREKRRRNRDAP